MYLNAEGQVSWSNRYPGTHRSPNVELQGLENAGVKPLLAIPVVQIGFPLAGLLHWKVLQ